MLNTDFVFQKETPPAKSRWKKDYGWGMILDRIRRECDPGDWYKIGEYENPRTANFHACKLRQKAQDIEFRQTATNNSSKIFARLIPTKGKK